MKSIRQQEVNQTILISSNIENIDVLPLGWINVEKKFPNTSKALTALTSNIVKGNYKDKENKVSQYNSLYGKLSWCDSRWKVNCDRQYGIFQVRCPEECSKIDPMAIFHL